MSKPVIRFQKAQKLHFLSRDEQEEIIKSSNNRESGIIQTYSKVKRKKNDYSVNFLLNMIEAGDIRLIPIETQA
jgi:hypothetical protein